VDNRKISSDQSPGVYYVNIICLAMAIESSGYNVPRGVGHCTPSTTSVLLGDDFLSEMRMNGPEAEFAANSDGSTSIGSEMEGGSRALHRRNCWLDRGDEYLYRA